MAFSMSPTEAMMADIAPLLRFTHWLDGMASAGTARRGDR